MGVDIVHIRDGQARVVQGQAHTSRCPLTIWGRSGNVVGVGRLRAPQQLGIDRGSSGTGMLQALQDQEPSPFTHDETVTVAVEGSTGRRQGLCTGRKGSHIGEAADGEWTDRSFRAPREHDICLTEADEARGGPERMISRCTGRGVAKGGASSAKPDRDLTSGEII